MATIIPRKGKRVVWLDYVEVPGENRYEQKEFTGIVLARVQKISRSSASESKAYYNVKDDSGKKHRVEPFQLLRYAEVSPCS